MKVRRKYIALGIIIPIVLVATILTLNAKEEEGPLFPMEVEGVKAIKYATGEQAIRMVMSIHWNPQAIKGVEDASVVLYSDGSRLWVTVFGSEEQAKELLSEMVNKISRFEAQLPYGKPIPHTFEGVTVYLIPDKRGGMHALWASGRYLVWLELGQKGIDLLKELIEYYSHS